MLLTGGGPLMVRRLRLQWCPHRSGPRRREHSRPLASISEEDSLINAFVLDVVEPCSQYTRLA